MITQKSIKKLFQKIMPGLVLGTGLLIPVSLSAGQLPPYQKYEGPVKPGIIINQQNLQQYEEELAKLLPPAKLQWYLLGLKKGLVTMPVVETKFFPPSKGYQEATRKYSKNCKVESNNQLSGWVAGTPFPDPKTVLELAWNCYPEISHGSSADDTKMPETKFSWFNIYKYEKYFSWWHCKKKFMGRTDISPLPQVKTSESSSVSSKETMFITQPFEARGFSMIRIRYWDINKTDDVYSYIPAIRRVRRLTGADVNDPVLGSDAIQDDFEVWRQKFSSLMTFKVTECRDFLAPCTYTVRPPELCKGLPCFQVNWELRPMWVMEIMINDPDYMYSRRIIYIDKEEGNFTIYWGEQYDQRGRMWRANGQGAVADNGDGLRNLFAWMYMNCITDHYTAMDMRPAPDFTPLDPAKIFSFKGLLRRAR